VLAPKAKLAWLRNLPADYAMLDPIKVTSRPRRSVSGQHWPRSDTCGCRQQFLWERGIVVEKTGLYSFLVLF